MKIDFKESVSKIISGELIAIPTDTVYGLAAHFLQEDAISNIFEIKGRKKTNPLPILISSENDLEHIVRSSPDMACELCLKFWPGPLTLTFEAKVDVVPSIVRSDLDTVAVRMPNHRFVRGLIDEVGPLVVTSANKSGELCAKTPCRVEEYFGNSFPVSACEEPVIGKESTVLVFQDNKWWIKRSGYLSSQIIGEVLGYLPQKL